MIRLTYHLVPVEVWTAADPRAPYEAASLASEGFIHCTDGVDELIATANRHYRDDPRPFLALSIDLDTTGSPWRIDDPGGIYPHVYGPIDRAAIVGHAPLVRDGDGQFLRLGPETSAT